ncbi:MAG: hypothetical protein KBB94_04570 [Legionellaceae bacterium]|nr:hypothetical protein [Legionellaceae bacterium]MBP9775454.1 hypothetical protein [Legionellaceae bacterium]
MMSWFELLKNNFNTNLTAMSRMDALFYQPAGSHLVVFLVKNIFSHLENNANGLVDPKNAIPLDSPISVFVNKRCRKIVPNQFDGFTIEDILQATTLIQTINVLPEVPEKLRIQSILISPSIDKAISFYCTNAKSQVLLISPDALQLPIESLRFVALQAISSSMLNVDTLSLTSTEEVAIALIISTAAGMLYNNLAATFVFDLAKQNQKNDNMIFVSVIVGALVLYSVISSINKDNQARAKQQMFRLFADQALVDPNPQQVPLQIGRLVDDRLFRHIADNTLGFGTRLF